MITIVAKNTVNPESIEAFKKTAAPLIEASQKEEGCHAYFLYQDIKNPGILTFIEEWSSEEAIKKHNESPHFKVIVPKLAPFCTAPGEVRLYKKI